MASLLAQVRCNLRVWAVFATVSWSITAMLWGCQRYMDPHDDYTDGGAVGMFTVSSTAEINGEVTHKLGIPVQIVAPGAMVGWTSNICVEKGLYLLTRPDMVRVRDRRVVQPGRERLWTPQDHRCGAVVAALQVPADAEPGLYEIQRSAWSSPLGWFPQRATLQSLRFRVAAGTKPTP